MNIKRLIEQGDALFSKRGSLLSLWQTIAENFYCERADFTVNRTLGEEFADHLTSSYPLIVRRELGDAISAMLRPRGQQWGSISIERADKLDNAGKKWLDMATKIQWRAMYDRQSQFVRATKEGDHDFAAFGQCVISKEVHHGNMVLLYRSWHLRDVAWCEQADCSIGDIHRNWQPSVRVLMQTFKNKPGAKLHANVIKHLDKQPERIVKCRHVVIPVGYYDGETKYKTPYVSLWIDIENCHLILEEPSADQIYCIPRWQTVSGSQYAYSPATVAGLPDARLIQAMTLTLLEAGEMAVRPPMVAAKEVIRGDIALFAGGITYVDAEYDERLGEALRPLSVDKNGIPFGIELEQDRRQMLSKAFYLDRLNMPRADHERTAYEISQIVAEYIRNALPLFEPMESSYNGGLCEMTFEDLLRLGTFGPPRDIPRSLRGQSVEFKFESPLHQAIERQKGQKFIEAKGLLLEAAQLDPSVIATMDAAQAVRDALNGIGVEAKWLRDEDAVAAQSEKVAQEQQAAKLLQVAQAGADVAATGAKAQMAAA